MTATTAQAPKTNGFQFLPVDNTSLIAGGIVLRSFFGGDVILDPPDGVFERGDVRCGGLAREVGPRDEAHRRPCKSGRARLRPCLQPLSSAANNNPRSWSDP